jgi:opacity protein-like surface antigen
MFKKLITIMCIFILGLFFANNCLADNVPNRRDYAIGWQVSGPASGFCLKIPYQVDYYIQPIFAISMSEKDAATTGNYALGIRGIYDLPLHQDFLPYAGVALGYSESYRRTTDSSSSNGNFGYEAFFGVEYQKYLLRPALEIGIGSSNNNDGSFHAGVIYNFSMLYYF